MSRILRTLGFLVLCLIVPATAAAQQASVSSEVLHLMAVAAALEAQVASLSHGQALACAALPSKADVAAGEPLALAWGSVGAMDPSEAPERSLWPQNGASELTIGQPGTWTYYFTFYAESGASTTCEAVIRVHPGQDTRANS